MASHSSDSDSTWEPEAEMSDKPKGFQSRTNFFTKLSMQSMKQRKHPGKLRTKESLLEDFKEFQGTADGERKPESTVSQDFHRLIKIHKAVEPSTGLQGMTDTDLVRDLWFESPLLRQHKPKSKKCAVDSLIRFYKFLRKRMPPVKGLPSRDNLTKGIDTLYAWKRSLRSDVAHAETDKFCNNLDHLITTEDFKKARNSLRDVEEMIDTIANETTVTTVRHHDFTLIHNYLIHSLDIESIGRASGLRSLEIDHWRHRVLHFCKQYHKAEDKSTFFAMS